MKLNRSSKAAKNAKNLEKLRQQMADIFEEQWPEVVADSKEILELMRDGYGKKSRISAWLEDQKVMRAENPKHWPGMEEMVMLACAVQLDTDERTNP